MTPTHKEIALALELSDDTAVDAEVEYEVAFNAGYDDGFMSASPFIDYSVPSDCASPDGYIAGYSAGVAKAHH